MAGGREFSDGQRRIIKRFYDTRETRAIQRLQEVVSELFVCEESAKKRLWISAGTALANLKIDDARARRIIAERDVRGLATLVAELK